MALTSHVQKFANVSDADISGCGATGGSNLKNKYIVLTHESTPLDTELMFRVDNVMIINGLPDSGADYEVKRVSTTQTIIKRKYVSVAPITVEVIHDTPIGLAVIGSTFKVG